MARLAEQRKNSRQGKQHKQKHGARNGQGMPQDHTTITKSGGWIQEQYFRVQIKVSFCLYLNIQARDEEKA